MPSAPMAAPVATWITDAREATPENAEITERVLELAQAWQAGDIPAAGVFSLCTGRERFIALNHLGKGSAEKLLLLELIEALCGYVDDGKAWQTKHGRFTRDDLIEWGGMMVGGRIIWPESGSHAHGWRYPQPKE